MTEQTNNKTIAKNTLALYIRMGFSMIVSLFTSRVILQVLGVTDMGIQASVGGVVGFAGFLNAALSNGSSRFLTYALGKGDMKEMRSTFSTVFWVHAALSVVVILLVETVGLWFLYNKLIIPADRMDAAIWVFHLSVLSMAVGMTQVPYSACVVAHEKMDMYAYTGIIETILKLLIVYALLVVSGDKLIWYSSFFFAVSMGMVLFYRWYCITKFEECKLQLKFDKEIFKPIAKFSGWQLFANVSIALSGQGVLIMLNMFFSPAIVAARSISLQVNTSVSQFMTNFRNASTPQIVKSYAAGDYERSKRLMFEVTKYSYYLMLFMSLPVFLLSKELLYLWLGQVPEYCDIFLKLVVIQSLFQIFDTGYYQAIYTKGRLKENALSSPILGIVIFGVVYILFKCGFSPVALSWMFIAKFAILGLIFKPVILMRVVGGYTPMDFVHNIWPCLKVTAIAVILPTVVKYYVSSTINNSYITFFTTGFVSVISVAITVWFFGIDNDTRTRVKGLINNKLHR